MFKKIITTLAIFVAVSALPALAATQYSIVNGNATSNGSIKILESLNSFTFNTNFGNIGNSGYVGFYTYTDNVSDAQKSDSTFRKSGGSTVDLGALEAGQNVGFYLVRNNGESITDFYFSEGKKGELTLTFVSNGKHGKGESMYIENIIATTSPSSPSSGQPLPGIWVTLGIAALAAGALFGVKKVLTKKKI